jgi:hypothetical protein
MEAVSDKQPVSIQISQGGIDSVHKFESSSCNSDVKWNLVEWNEFDELERSRICPKPIDLNEQISSFLSFTWTTGGFFSLGGTNQNERLGETFKKTRFHDWQSFLSVGRSRFLRFLLSMIWLRWCSSRTNQQKSLLWQKMSAFSSVPVWLREGRKEWIVNTAWSTSQWGEVHLIFIPSEWHCEYWNSRKWNWIEFAHFLLLCWLLWSPHSVPDHLPVRISNNQSDSKTCWMTFTTDFTQVWSLKHASRKVCVFQTQSVWNWWPTIHRKTTIWLGGLTKHQMCWLQKTRTQYWTHEKSGEVPSLSGHPIKPHSLRPNRFSHGGLQNNSENHSAKWHPGKSKTLKRSEANDTDSINSEFQNIKDKYAFKFWVVYPKVYQYWKVGSRNQWDSPFEAFFYPSQMRWRSGQQKELFQSSHNWMIWKRLISLAIFFLPNDIYCYF